MVFWSRKEQFHPVLGSYRHNSVKFCKFHSVTEPFHSIFHSVPENDEPPNLLFYLSYLSKRQGFNKKQSLYEGASLTKLQKLETNKYKTNNKDNTTYYTIYCSKTMHTKVYEILVPWRSVQRTIQYSIKKTVFTKKRVFVGIFLKSQLYKTGLPFVLNFCTNSCPGMAPVVLLL